MTEVCGKQSAVAHPETKSVQEIREHFESQAGHSNQVLVFASFAKLLVLPVLVEWVEGGRRGRHEPVQSDGQMSASSAFKFGLSLEISLSGGMQ